MAAPTETYVDPSIAADSGAGSIGDPYGDLQYALDNVTRDATNGDRFNIKAGTAELPTGTLSLATYGTSLAADAPLIFQGYTSAAGDGGKGEINGGAGNFTLMPATQFIICRDLKLHNTGTAGIIVWNAVNWNLLERCEFATSTNARALYMGTGTRVLNCSFSGGWAAAQNIVDFTTGLAIGNWFNVDAAVGNALTFSGNDGAVALRNIFSCGAVASTMLRVQGRGGIISQNSILAAAATGIGISLEAAGDGVIVTNNIVEGFSGTGGDGIQVASGAKIALYAGNAYYNNTANETGVSGAVFCDGGDNEALGSSPFAKSGANTFANRFVYFAPNDVGNVYGGAYPTS